VSISGTGRTPSLAVGATRAQDARLDQQARQAEWDQKAVVRTLDSSADRAEATAKDADKVADRSEQRANDLRGDVSRERKDLDKAQDELRRQEGDVTKAQSQVDSAQRDVDAARKAVDAARRDVSGATRAVADAERALKTAETRLDTAKRTRDDAKDAVNRAKDTVKDAEKAVNKAEDRVKDAQRDVDKARDKVADERRDVSKARAEVSEAQGRVRDAKGTLADANAAVKREQQDVARATDAVAAADRKLDTATRGLDKAKGAEARAGDALKQAEAKVGTLDGKVRSANDRVKGAHEKAAAADREVAAARGDVSRARSALASAEARLRRDPNNRELQAAVRRARDNVASAERRLGAAVSKLSSAKAEVTAAERALADAKRQLDEAKRRAEQARIELDRARKAREAAEKTLKQAKEAVAEAKKQLKEQQQQLEKAQKAQEKAQKDLDKAQKDLTKAEKELDKQQGELKKAEQQLAKATDALQDARQALKSAQTKLDTAKRRLEAAEQKLKRAEQSVKDAEKAKDKAKDRVGDAKDDLKKAQKALDKAEDKVGDARKDLDKAKKRLTEERSDVTKAKQKVAAEQNQLKAAESKLSSAEATAKSDRAKANRLEGEARTARRKVETAEQRRRDLDAIADRREKEGPASRGGGLFDRAASFVTAPTRAAVEGVRELTGTAVAGARGAASILERGARAGADMAKKGAQAVSDAARAAGRWTVENSGTIAGVLGVTGLALSWTPLGAPLLMASAGFAAVDTARTAKAVMDGQASWTDLGIAAVGMVPGVGKGAQIATRTMRVAHTAARTANIADNAVATYYTGRATVNIATGNGSWQDVYAIGMMGAGKAAGRVAANRSAAAATRSSEAPRPSTTSTTGAAVARTQVTRAPADVTAVRTTPLAQSNTGVPASRVAGASGRGADAAPAVTPVAAARLTQLQESGAPPAFRGSDANGNAGSNTVEHFIKHRKEFNGDHAIDGVRIDTPRAYEQRAQQLVRDAGSGADGIHARAIDGSKPGETKLAVYNERTGEFVVVGNRGNIETLHRLGLDKTTRNQSYHLAGQRNWNDLAGAGLLNRTVRRQSNEAQAQRLADDRSRALNDRAGAQQQLATYQSKARQARADVEAAAVGSKERARAEANLAKAESQVARQGALLADDATFSAWSRSISGGQQRVVATQVPRGDWDASAGRREFDALTGRQRSAAGVDPNREMALFGRRAQPMAQANLAAAISAARANPGTVTVRRSSGDVEGNWRLMQMPDGSERAFSVDAQGREISRAVRRDDDFYRLNPQELIGASVLVRRSSGQVEGAWVVSRMGDLPDTVVVSHAGVGSKTIGVDQVLSGLQPSSDAALAARVSGAALRQSLEFRSMHELTGFEPIANGYIDGGRGMRIDADGSRGASSREVLVVDRTRDAALRSHLTVARNLRDLPPAERAQAIARHIDESMGGQAAGIDTRNNAAVDRVANREVLIGQVPRALDGTGVCRHRSLLFKVMADEAGLDTTIRRGEARYGEGGGAHAWNEVVIDGRRMVVDVMNPHARATDGAFDFVMPADSTQARSVYHDFHGSSIYGQRAAGAA
jgi:predicted  nucleic acid-binding Zn-ribbon protein